MKPELFNKKPDKIFKWFTNESDPSLLKLRLDVYKKLWNFFLVGDSYYFEMDHHRSSIDFVSKEVEDVMGYTPSEFSIQFMNDKLHPDDYPWLLTFGNRMIEFFSQLPLEKILKYTVRYDIRFRNKKGDYRRILCQRVMLEHEWKFPQIVKCTHEYYIPETGRQTHALFHRPGWGAIIP